MPVKVSLVRVNDKSLDLSRLESDLARKETELDAFKRIANTLTAHLDLKEVLELVSAEALKLISDVVDVNIFLVDANGLRFGATYDRRGTAKEAFAQPREHGLTNTVKRSGEMIVVEDMRDHPLFVTAPKDWVGSIIGAPLKVRDRVIGVMNIARDLAGKFSDAELALVDLLASQAAIAISNARLHEALSIQSHQLERLVAERTDELNRTNAELSANIAELHRAQEQLVEQKKMASLGTLVAGVAHEINTPIGSSITAITYIQHSLDALNEQFESEALTRSDLQKYIQMSRQAMDLTASNLERAAKLVNAFKVLSSNPDGQEISSFDLHDVLSKLIFTFTARLQGGGLTLETDVPENLTVHGYQAAVVQIITILIMNSLQHAFPDGPGGNIRIAAGEEGGMIRLVYQDDGKGLSEEELQRIFEPFFTTGRSKGSLGLGMSELYNLVHHLLRGEVRVTGETGVGMMCEISFPSNASHPQKTN